MSAQAREGVSRQDVAPLLLLPQSCRAAARGLGAGRRGQSTFPGPAACPSHQDLPDPMHDATQVQLPHCGSAFHDETGEVPGGRPEPSPTSLALGPPPGPRAFAQALSSAWNTLPATLSAPFWPPQGHLPRWTVSPLSTGTALNSSLFLQDPGQHLAQNRWFDKFLLDE